MRISKSTKTSVQASGSVRPFEVQDLATGKWSNISAENYRKAVEKLCGCSVEPASNSKDADYLVQYQGSQSDKYKTRTGSYGQTKYFKKSCADGACDVDACGNVKASKRLSANEQALTHIRAAIDILGKSGQKDDITKDTIANLGIVMFDLKGDK